MSRHRAEPPPPRTEPTGHRHAATAVRPRYGRLAVLCASISVTGVAVLGSLGVLPSVATSSSTGDPSAPSADADLASTVLSAAEPTGPASSPSPDAEVSTVPTVPADSGSGLRVVFDQSEQRVWLVRGDESVARTYLVSGSVTDNLGPGSYEVYSRSANAYGIDDSGTMQYFVRFTQGTNGSAIGFHDIPVDDGEPLQTTDQLGTPQSHGCIRQARKDAIAMWGFAPIGTDVEVVA